MRGILGGSGGGIEHAHLLLELVDALVRPFELNLRSTVNVASRQGRYGEGRKGPHRGGAVDVTSLQGRYGDARPRPHRRGLPSLELCLVDLHATQSRIRPCGT